MEPIQGDGNSRNISLLRKMPCYVDSAVSAWSDVLAPCRTGDSIGAHPVLLTNDWFKNKGGQSILIYLHTIQTRQDLVTVLMKWLYSIYEEECLSAFKWYLDFEIGHIMFDYYNLHEYDKNVIIRGYTSIVSGDLNLFYIVATNIICSFFMYKELALNHVWWISHVLSLEYRDLFLFFIGWYMDVICGHFF